MASVAILLQPFFFNSLGGEFCLRWMRRLSGKFFSMRRGTNLSEMVATSNQMEKIMMDSFPEVSQVVAKSGRVKFNRPNACTLC